MYIYIILYWLVVWNMAFIFPYIGNVIVPTDFHIFQRGRSTKPNSMAPGIPAASYRWWPGHIGPRATYTRPTWYFHAGFTAYMYYPKEYVPF